MRRKFLKVKCQPGAGSMILEDSYDGWPGSGFRHQTNRLKVRRVEHTDNPGVQLEMMIRQIKGERRFCYEMHGGIVVPLEAVPELCDALMRDYRERLKES